MGSTIAISASALGGMVPPATNHAWKKSSVDGVPVDRWNCGRGTSGYIRAYPGCTGQVYVRDAVRILEDMLMSRWRLNADLSTGSHHVFGYPLFCSSRYV